MLCNRIAIALAAATLCVAGCSNPGLRGTGPGREMWRPTMGQERRQPAEDAAVANAREAIGPKILPETHDAAGR